VSSLPELHDFDQSDSQPWDRQPNEPSRAYAAFRLFRDMPATQRKPSAVPDISLRSAERWCANWNWRARADAWDDACAQVDDQERLEAIRQMHGVHRKAGRLAVLKAVQALNMLSAEDMLHSPSIIARMLELGAKLERSTLIVSVEELQGLEVEDEESDDPWERIARELDPAHVAVDG
jgi:hypothetical protein